MTETDLTPRQAVHAYLGGEPVPPHVLRAAVAQYVCGYETLVDLAQDVVGDPCDISAGNDLAAEIIMQQTMLEEFFTLTSAATALPDLVRSRQPSRRTRA
ncbi:hypothetical protein [Agrobacterium genomosp. 2]|uniref:Uncharacterized protein n=1 Tax=Agrobacterium genomosp. 2 str. CFBP 5494 TaxID=1183436 RepID=A0A9W5AYL8_9HYPH|nr:hypothetical protein [Agrobacterium genomosp. 2]CUW87548.1 hypothetical protein AGR2A_Cc120093 [Agrobacterium genomosp. 2 str. CFBP 5494]